MKLTIGSIESRIKATQKAAFKLERLPEPVYIEGIEELEEGLIRLVERGTSIEAIAQMFLDGSVLDMPEAAIYRATLEKFEDSKIIQMMHFK